MDKCVIPFRLKNVFPKYVKVFYWFYSGNFLNEFFKRIDNVFYSPSWLGLIDIVAVVGGSAINQCHN